jgi:hypothetical protein
MIQSHEGKLEENVRPIQPIGKRYIFCPSDHPLEEEEEEEEEQKEGETDESSEEEKDSEESSEEDDDRKIKKRRPLYGRPKKLYRPFSTYSIVSGWTFLSNAAIIAEEQ